MAELQRQLSLEDVLITDRLEFRKPAKADYLAEKQALQELAVQMTENPQAVLPSLVDLALDITGGVSGGISLFEEEAGTPGIFRWHYLRGEMARFTGGTTPRNYSPCGVCLDEHRAILVQRPERYYTWLVEAGVSVPECLLVPLYVKGSEPLGTLWVVSEEEEYFDSNHARALNELASFTGLAIHMLRGERQLKRTLERQATLAREMNHRLQNLFTMVDGMIRITAGSADSPATFAESLSKRINALAAATALARPTRDDIRHVVSLVELLETTLRHHDPSGEIATPQICLNGPEIELGDQSAQNISLLIHEFATNAAKYGALTLNTGSVEVSWRVSEGKLHLDWHERGGPRIEAGPSRLGFGTRLARSTVRFLGSTIDYDWRAEGLAIHLSFPLDRLED